MGDNNSLLAFYNRNKVTFEPGGVRSVGIGMSMYLYTN